MAGGGTLFNSPNTSLLMGAAPKTQLGSVGALITTMRQTGVSTGIALAGLIFTVRQSHHAALIATQQTEPIIIKRLAMVEAFSDATFLAMLLPAACVVVIALILDKKALSHSPPH
jgi:hypothetical protein